MISLPAKPGKAPLAHELMHQLGYEHEDALKTSELISDGGLDGEDVRSDHLVQVRRSVLGFK